MQAPHRTLVGTFLLLIMATPLWGQSYRGAIGLNGGGTWFSDFTPKASVETMIEPGWIAGAQLERWADHGWYGLRLNAAFTIDEISPPGEGLDLYAGDVNLLVRPLHPDPWRMFAPYIAIGAGALHYDVHNTEPFETGAVTMDRNPTTLPAAMAGLGVDIRPHAGFGLRVEVADHVTVGSPFFEASGAESSGAVRPVHHARATIGVSMRLGELPITPKALAFGDDDRSRPAERSGEATRAEAPVPTPDPESDPEPRRDATDRPEEARRVNRAVMPSEISELQARINALTRAMKRNTESMRGIRSTLAGGAGTSARTAPDRTEAASEQANPDRRAAAEQLPSRLYTVQVASFTGSNAAVARTVADQLRGRGLPVWIASVEVSGTIFHRVRVGALPNRPDARTLGNRIRREYDWPVWVAPVENRHMIPADAVASSRRFLEGS